MASEAEYLRAIDVDLKQLQRQVQLIVTQLNHLEKWTAELQERWSTTSKEP